MAKAKIRENGHVYAIELDGKYTKKQQEMLERLGIIEREEKPKRKKKYKNVEQKKDETEENGEAYIHRITLCNVGTLYEIR